MAQTIGVGTVVSKDPLVTAMADLRNNELVLTMRLPVFITNDGTPASGINIRIKGDKLDELVRFALLAQGQSKAVRALSTAARTARVAQEKHDASA
jgi:hypothetical protein